MTFACPDRLAEDTGSPERSGGWEGKEVGGRSAVASKGATRLAGHADALAAALANNAGASSVLGNIRLADSSDSFAFAFTPGEGADKVLPVPKITEP